MPRADFPEEECWDWASHTEILGKGLSAKGLVGMSVTLEGG